MASGFEWRLTPSAEQQAILRVQTRLLMIEANAGTGKTTTEAMRVAQHLDWGAAPGSVMFLTYSDPGCIAAKRALATVGISGDLVRQLTVQTFRLFATSRLDKLFGTARELASPEDARSSVLAAVERARRTAIDKGHGDSFSISGTGALSVEALLNDFNVIKNTLPFMAMGSDFILTPESAHSLGWDFTTMSVFLAHERIREGPFTQDAGCPLFRFRDDATYDLAQALTADEPLFSTATPLALDLSLVLVDEMSDMSWAMCVILRELLRCNPRAHCICAGDVDQVLHTDSGADAYFMRDGLEKELGPATRMPLRLTRRFGSQVAERLGRHAGKEYASLGGASSAWIVLEAPTAANAAERIADVLSSARGASTSTASPAASRKASRMGQASGSRVAVLLRHSSRSVELETALLAQGTSYRTVGFTSYLRRPEILFTRAILGCALGVHDEWSQDRQAREELVAATLMYLTDADTADGKPNGSAAFSVSQIAAGSAETFSRFLHGHLLGVGDPRVTHRVNAAIGIAQSDQVTDISRFAEALDIGQLASGVLVKAADVASAIESVQGFARSAAKFGSHDSITAFLRTTADREFTLRANQTSDRYVVLSTIAAAKGLEWDHVVIPDANAGDFDGPSIDERNLFYVAASRARRSVTLLHSGVPSAYLQALPNRQPARPV